MKKWFVGLLVLLTLVLASSTAMAGRAFCNHCQDWKNMEFVRYQYKADTYHQRVIQCPDCKLEHFTSNEAHTETALFARATTANWRVTTGARGQYLTRISMSAPARRRAAMRWDMRPTPAAARPALRRGRARTAVRPTIQTTTGVRGRKLTRISMSVHAAAAIRRSPVNTPAATPPAPRRGRALSAMVPTRTRTTTQAPTRTRMHQAQALRPSTR